MRNTSRTFSILFVCLVASRAWAGDEFSISNIDRASWHWASEGQLQLNEYNSSRPPQLVFFDPTEISECRLGKISCNPNEPITLVVDVKRPKPFIARLRYKARGKSKSIVISLLSQVSPDFKVTGASNLDKNILISPWHYAMVLSPKGELVYYRDFEFFVQDFRQHIVKGAIYYSIVNVTTSNIKINSEGPRLILDENFKVIEKFDHIVDGHEFHYLGPKHYLFMTYDDIETPAGTCYINQTISEEKNGKSIYRFSIFDFFKQGYLAEAPYKFPFRGRNCNGNSHLNAVQIVDKDRWLISLGNGSIFLWNKATGKPEWIFSGPEDQFDLKPKQLTHLHHTPRWFPDEGRLTVFDNDYQTQTTRLLDFKLDPVKKMVVTLKEIPLSNGYSIFGGSLEIDRENIFSVGFGMRAKGKWDFAEIEDGRRNMTIQFQKQSFGPYSYRVYRGIRAVLP